MRTQSLDNLCAWIEQTPLSQAIQVTAWSVPAVQTVHILAIAAVMASVLMLNLRLLGVVGVDRSIAEVSARIRPVIWWTLPILLVSGLLLIIGEPVRSLENPIFQVKMLMLITVIVLTLAYQVPLTKDSHFWERSGRSITIKLIAIVSLALWVAIVCAGRWIAYV
jgi:uncharacterized membrane protein SirB2